MFPRIPHNLSLTLPPKQQHADAPENDGARFKFVLEQFNRRMARADLRRVWGGKLTSAAGVAASFGLLYALALIGQW